MKQVKSKIINKASIWYNNLLASDLHHSFEKWVGKLIDDTPTIYDKAIDKNYILTQVVLLGLLFVCRRANLMESQMYPSNTLQSYQNLPLMLYRLVSLQEFANPLTWKENRL